MKSLKRAFYTAILAFVGLAGCSAHAQKKPDQPEGKNGEVSLRFDKSGMLVPVTKEGVPFAICGNEKRNSCSLFKEKITLTSMEAATIMRFEHKINPTCVVYAVMHAGKTFYFYDKTDPNCAEFNK